MDIVEADLAAQIKCSEGLQGQVQLSQDRVAEACAATAAAEVELSTAEQKAADLASSLSSAKVNHDQAVEELQGQHVNRTQVDTYLLVLSSCTKALPCIAVSPHKCDVISMIIESACVCTDFVLAAHWCWQIFCVVLANLLRGV